MKSLDAASKHLKECRRLLITRLNLMWLLTRSHDMINHSLRALVGGGGAVGMTMKYSQGLYRCLKVLEIQHYRFKALNSLKNSIFFGFGT